MGLTGLRSGSKSKDSKSSSKRKHEKKLGFYNKVQDAIVKKSKSKTKKLRSRQKKLKAYNLSALAEFLPDLEALAITKATAITKEEKINCKSRQTLVQREAAKMQAVLNDPTFMKDPFETIHKRLLETQPPVQEENKSASKGKRKERKKRVKKGKSSSQDMEI